MSSIKWDGCNLARHRKVLHGRRGIHRYCVYEHFFKSTQIWWNTFWRRFKMCLWIFVSWWNAPCGNEDDAYKLYLSLSLSLCMPLSLSLSPSNCGGKGDARVSKCGGNFTLNPKLRSMGSIRFYLPSILFVSGPPPFKGIFRIFHLRCLSKVFLEYFIYVAFQRYFLNISFTLETNSFAGTVKSSVWNRSLN